MGHHRKIFVKEIVLMLGSADKLQGGRIADRTFRIPHRTDVAEFGCRKARRCHRT